MVVRYAICIPIIIGMGRVAPHQNSTRSESARITLALPYNIPSETVQINYFMSGPFGGYAGFVRAEKDKSGYDIAASMEGKPARNVKIIVYMPGCEIVLLDLPVTPPIPPQLLTCKRLKTIWMRGQINPASVLLKGQPTEVEISYLATWDHRFFGIADGIVTSIQVAIAVPDRQGQFEVLIPDFGGQTNLGEGMLELTLRNAKTGNIISSLWPTVEGKGFPWVRVRPSYPSVIELLARP